MMKQNTIIWLASILLLGGCSMSKNDNLCDGPKPMIFDTDWWTDVDDACAVRILLNADKKGEIDVEGVCLSAVDNESYESIGKFMANEGYTDIPVGADKEGTDFEGVPGYRKPILESSNDKPLTDKDVMDCVDFYRKILSTSKRKVDIVAVGFPNTLSKLLKSSPDKWSPLNGIDLVKEKAGTLYLMAGNYPEGKEHNFCNAPRSREAGYVVCQDWPGEIVFLGFEVGIQVVAGGGLPHDDLLYKVLEAHGSAEGRFMWDPLTLVIGILGSPEKAGFESVRGTCIVNPETGENTFAENPNGKHTYVKMTHEPEWYAERLNAMLGEGKSVSEAYGL